MMRRIIIIGATSGIGLELANLFIKKAIVLA
jgi:short-subunit dehydrogenase